MMNGMSPVKFKQLTRVVRIVMQIMFWISIIGPGLMAVGGIVMLLLPDSHFIVSEGYRGSMGFSMDGMVRYQLDPTDVIGMNFKPIINTIILMAALGLGGVAAFIRQITLILTTVEDDRPFAEENGTRLSILGAILIAGAFLIPVAQFIVARMVISRLDIAHIHIYYKADGTMMVVGLLLIILAGVFRYGNYLQQEYDDTI